MSIGYGFSKIGKLFKEDNLLEALTDWATKENVFLYIKTSNRI